MASARPSKARRRRGLPARKRRKIRRGSPASAARLPPSWKLRSWTIRARASSRGRWAKTASSFFPGGWFRPNDIGYLDAEGFLYYLDRAKDRIQTVSGIVYPHVV